MKAPLPNSHSFAALSDGDCHYRLDGPASGRTLVMIHGATVPHWQFDRLVPFLNGTGIRTLRLDLFGHGYSARPAVVHDYALFTRQVAELLGHLGICRDIDLLGHSLGAVVAARLLSLEPSRYGALVITAPMLNFSGVNGAMNLLSAPIVGELLMYLYVLPMLVCRRTIRYRKIEDGRFVTMFRQQFRVPGFGRSLLSLVRSGALGDQGPCYIALRELPNPVMLLSGSHDVIANPAQMKTLQEILPRAEPRVVDGASHALLLTHPAQAAAHISRFLA